jgi:hypothetical protein
MMCIELSDSMIFGMNAMSWSLITIVTGLNCIGGRFFIKNNIKSVTQGYRDRKLSGSILSLNSVTEYFTHKS